jgi:hypothetical protein
MHPTPRHAVAADWPAVGSTHAGAGADRAWSGLHRARLGNRPDAIAAAEDRVFRLYLPLARALASELFGGGAAAPADVEWAAELGLAKAVLSWPGADGRGFEAYAREAITARLRQLSSSHPQRRASAAQLSSMVRRFPTGGRPTGR